MFFYWFVLWKQTDLFQYIAKYFWDSIVNSIRVRVLLLRPQGSYSFEPAWDANWGALSLTISLENVRLSKYTQNLLALLSKQENTLRMAWDYIVAWLAKRLGMWISNSKKLNFILYIVSFVNVRPQKRPNTLLNKIHVFL